MSATNTVIQGTNGQIQLKSNSYVETQSTRVEFKNAADNATRNSGGPVEAQFMTGASMTCFEIQG